MADIVKKYEKSTLYPTDILKECPRFRILIIGQSGAGKTALCGKVFGVDAQNPTNVKEVRNVSLSSIYYMLEMISYLIFVMQLGVSGAFTRGTEVSQVWKEITFDGRNEDIILHDSGGFEVSNESKFDEIRRFIDYRLGQTKLADQLHCIWYYYPFSTFFQLSIKVLNVIGIVSR